MADLYVCSSDGKSYPTETEYVHHQETAHPLLKRCLSCGVVLDDPEDPAVQGCASSRGFEHDRVVDAWTTDQMRERFEVIGFGYGLCVVRRRSDGAKGTLEFDHAPRFYYNFAQDPE